MKHLLVGIVSLLLTAGAFAGTHSINLSLAPDYAIYDRTETIEGFTLSLVGENPQTALSLGIVNGSTGKSAGFTWGFIANYADDYQGVQWAMINWNQGDFLGWQSGLVNYTGGTMKGYQSGVVNYAGKLNGFQLGFVNWAETTTAGLQIGFINVMRDNTVWFGELPGHLAPAMIIVNWRF